MALDGEPERSVPIAPVGDDAPWYRTPDWSRERSRRRWDPGQGLIRSIRSYQNARGPLKPLVRGLAVLRHRFWSAVTSCDIPLNVEIGGGVRIPHAVGIIIHPKVKIGPNCLIMQNVTIGRATGFDVGAPVLEAGVDVSVGAVVIGDIRIGERALIAANAVVTTDVPPHQVVGGVPAKPIGVREVEPS